MKANKMIVTALVLGSSLLAGCAGQTKPAYDKPEPVIYGEQDENGIRHLVNDSQRLEMRGHFCYEIPVEEQRPGANCIPTGGVGGVSGE